ncbi:MAG: MarR family transcriptional regulator [Pseudomonadota bacterium]
MASQSERTRKAISSMLRVLKIMEPGIQTAHDRFKANPSDIAAIHFLGDNPGCRAANLAAHLGLAPTTVSSLLDRLEKMELIRRDRPRDDRRTVALNLSDLGAKSREEIIVEEVETAKRMLDCLPKDRRSEFVASLEMIAEQLAEDG